MRTRFISLSCMAFLLGAAIPALADDIRLPFTPSTATRDQTIYGSTPGTKAPAYDSVKNHQPATAAPYKEPVVPQAPSSLLTETSVAVGATFSHYVYQEPDPDMQVNISGLKYGLTLEGTLALPEQFFVKLDGRYAIGKDDYSSLSGQAKDEKDNIAEFRLVAGRDFVLAPQISLSPYTGIGYRILYNDARGITSLGAAGYRRESQYTYVPIGVTPRYLLNKDARISMDLEYDQLISGKQMTHLGDAGVISTGYSSPSSGTFGDIKNYQYSGFGLRGNVMYEAHNWSIGPFFDYWNINMSKSASATLTDTSGTLYTACCFNEPHNQTLEYGLQFKYRLY